MNKICTSIEQSKKLLELGINTNTADMIYQPIMDIDSMNNVGFAKIPLCFPFNETKECNIQYLPAWSLSALLELIKSEIYGETIYGDTITYKVDFRKYKFTDDVDLYQIAYGSIKFDVDGQHSFRDMINTSQKEDPIDAAFEMVCWLLENNKI